MRIDKFTKYRVALIAIALMFVGACSEQGANVSDVGNEPPLSVERSVGFDGDIIRLGVIANLSGPGSSLDRTRLTGVTAYWSDINASGGVGGRYAVELEILDHGGNPEVAEGLVPELLDGVVALTFIDETAMGAVHPFLVEGQVLGVAPTSTLDWESDPRFLTHSPPVEAVVLALFESTPSSKWCVITDGSPLGVGVRNSAPQAARIAGAQSVTLIEVEEDLNAAILAAACEHVFAEVSEKFQEKLVTSIPARRTVLRQAGLTDPIVGRTDIQFAYIDSGPAWHVDAAVGMRPFLASLLRHAPDAKPDTRLRDGYVSQIGLDELLVQAVRGGDLRRSNI
ncbi:MAG: ABC transporter substrate-binding protein, partial [Actinomycetota bacterium]|nr:ABC transporter substrate-binding protein [Actinomycetota bacterium]